MTTTSRDLPVPARALAVGAHPDDVEFGCGATLARWAEAGCEVSLLVCTDGSKGTWDPGADLADLVALRQREQRDAAAALGATGEVAFLGRVDGDLVADRRATSEVALWIRRLRPDVLLGHDPWRRHRLHPDHRAAGRLVVDGLVAARDPHFFPEHEVAHHRPGALLLFEADVATHAEVVGAAHVDAKADALEAHRSQFETTMGITEADDGTERARFRRRLHDDAATAGRRVGRAAAELFATIRTDR
ncbi:PIG-L family deacetylase [Iamia majanohamensis]|uniref:PIG-L family deacetylase n=1 Tax=Iamia majanohamensis TaxID=467976 RepID=A0AAF0BX63_9ACTN|nr:PIG-L deacetylase family protein [Iamia majanohamensis]WCO68319.1 PIG-L family deacetylase [Iamia majanohamensis]